MKYQDKINRHLCTYCKAKLPKDYWYTECVECRKKRAERYRARKGEKAKAFVSYEEEYQND